VFRTAALERAATHRQCGEVVLQHSVSSTVLVAMFGAIAISIVAFFCTFGVTRKAQVTGMLLPAQGAIRVISQQQAVVVERRVQEGNYHLSYAICLLAVAGLAFISQDSWRGQETSCPNHALAARLTEEHRLRGAIDTAKFQSVSLAFVDDLVALNTGVCLISESTSGAPLSGAASLYRERKTGQYYLVFSGGLAEGEKTGFGPIPE
jgi:hypothetical protein